MLVASDEINDALTCLIVHLDKNKEESWAWSYLGKLYEDSKSTKSSSYSNLCLKQAVKLSGKVNGSIKEWHYLGPFVIGKTEVDGDPLAFYGGIKNVSTRRIKKEKYYSELVPNGEISWKTYKQESVEKYVEIIPSIQWNELVGNLGSTAITEWQGWVFGEFFVNENKVNIVIQCLRVHTIYVNDIMLVGDVYDREQYYFSVNLNRGVHTLYIRLRAKGQQLFRCKIQESTSNIEINKPHYMPDIWNGYLFSNYFSLPITNMQSSQWLKIIRITLEEQSEGEPLRVSLIDESQLSIAPGQTLAVKIQIHTDTTLIAKSGCSLITLKLKVISSDGKLIFPVQLRCRRRDESFLFTFLDHDGSVQHGAGVHPIEDCPGHLCPMLLTLHGTTVPPQNQADSYKRMVNNNYLFGADYAWLVAPTRHGAHNWEGPGAITALKAMDSFCDLVQRQDWIINKPSCNHVIFAGHSMGGHGAWNLATHFPDKALALVSLSGWIKKEEYGDSNLLFRHDISTSHVDPFVKAVMESCIEENDVDRLVSNLQGIPVMIRSGANDRTVHPFFTRRMYRILKEQDINVTYAELAGKEHWWWDTIEANDGGCVSDKQIRDFTNQLSVIPRVQSCEAGDYCEVETTNIWKSQLTKFKFTVVNPAFGGTMRGIRILQQVIMLRMSTITMNEGFERIYLKTENVRMFSISEPWNRPIGWSKKEIEVDGISLENKLTSTISVSTSLCYCLSSDIWELCESCETYNTRLPGTQGPARTIAENNFVIIPGSQSSDEESANNLALSVYVANLFFLTSDAYAPIITDSELAEEQFANNNLIVIGNSYQNKFSGEFLSRLPFVFNEEGHLNIGKCKFSDYGLLTLSPHVSGRLSMVLLSSDQRLLRQIVSLATPTIPPMTRSPFSNLIPDFVIIGNDFEAKGPGGYLCIGHYTNSWQLSSTLISCPQCLLN